MNDVIVTDITTVRTKEIAEAAVYYMNRLEMVAYKGKHWLFKDSDSKSEQLRLDLINKKVQVEPLEFMDAVRRVKSFSNGTKKDI